MKIRYILLNSFFQFLSLFLFLIIKTPKREYIDLTVLIIVLNLITFIFMSASLNRKLQFFVAFFGLSFLSLIIQIFIFAGVIYLFQNFHLLSNSSGFLKYTVFALKQIKGYNNIFGSIKIIITYLIFTMIPSYLVLSLDLIKAKKQNKRKRKKHTYGKHFND